MTLIPANLKSAFDAFVSFVDAEQNTRPNILKNMRDEKVAKLRQYFDTLMEAAQKGLDVQLPPLLNVLLQEWAIKEAAEYILRNQHNVIDAYDPGLQHDFWGELVKQHQVVSSKLLLELHNGNERRGRDWYTVAKQGVDEKHRLNQEAFQRERQLYADYQQVNGQLFNQYHQAEQDWARVAFNGIQQQQQGLQQYYNFAAQIHQQAAGMMSATQQHQYQNLPEQVEKRKLRSKIVKILIWLVVAGIVLWGCGIISNVVLMGAFRSF